MLPDPFLGVIFHWMGGLAAVSFYVPYKRLRRWSREVFWIVGGAFSWIVAPMALRTLYGTGSPESSSQDAIRCLTRAGSA
jgi:L-rhamnose-H+ transport protein